MAWEARQGLKLALHHRSMRPTARLTGLGSPSGIEIIAMLGQELGSQVSNWPGEPVRD